MELQNTVKLSHGESLNFSIASLDSIVFRLALLFGTLREVEVEFGVEYLPVFFLGWNVVPIHL